MFVLRAPPSRRVWYLFPIVHKRWKMNLYMNHINITFNKSAPAIKLISRKFNTRFSKVVLALLNLQGFSSKSILTRNMTKKCNRIQSSQFNWIKVVWLYLSELIWTKQTTSNQVVSDVNCSSKIIKKQKMEIF